MLLDFDSCYRAVCSRDPRFDGRFFIGVTTTGIYCRPICPAQTPKPGNVRFYACAAAAGAAGFRACRRCRPETSPGSPDWNIRADLVARALRLIAEGVVDAEGVGGLARRLAVSARHLHRELVAEVGAGPLALARTRRAQTARLLIDQTALPLTTVAFTSGFDSIRQFNDTMRASFGCPPSTLRRQPGRSLPGAGEIVLRLRYRPPYAAEAMLDFLGARAIPGVEEVTNGRYRRTVQTQRSRGIISLEPQSDSNTVLLRLGFEDLTDLPLVVQRSRQLFDLDADPSAIAGTLGDDPLLRPLLEAQPGLRIPGAMDGFEMAVRAILGQQISVAGARTMVARLVARLGDPLSEPNGTLTHCFPSAAAVAAADLQGIGLTGARIVSLRALAGAVARGEIVLDRGANRLETSERLLALPGVGPWTAACIALRALGDPDALPATDLGLRRALERLDGRADPGSITAIAEAWRPWRGYAVLYLWHSLTRAYNAAA
jgi:AraC family transcriptional regulator, regulatory protein of adaptative response / DNA-3-methyladenine glycosylase II